MKKFSDEEILRVIMGEEDFTLANKINQLADSDPELAAQIRDLSEIHQLLQKAPLVSRQKETLRIPFHWKGISIAAGCFLLGIVLGGYFSSSILDQLNQKSDLLPVSEYVEPLTWNNETLAHIM